MPPKRTNSTVSVKRKASSSDEDLGEASQSSKKTRLSSPGSTGASSQVDKANLTIHFPPRIPGTLRLATWNVCSLAASQKKGFKQYLEAEDPDILVLTETKVNNEPVDLLLKERFPYSYWSISDKKGYSGTAILSKHEPISVTKTLPGHPNTNSVKGRIVTLEFQTCYLVGTYVVNAGEKLKTLEAKKEWNLYFQDYIRDLDKKKPVIWTGDMNVAPSEIDLANAKRHWNKTPGYTEVETTAFKNILDPPESATNANKFVDVWRRLHPTDQHYTYFSYRFNCRAKGIGWRLDMFVLSERIVDRVKMCEIRGEVYGSDHCPLVLEIEGGL